MSFRAYPGAASLDDSTVTLAHCSTGLQKSSKQFFTGPFHHCPPGANLAPCATRAEVQTYQPPQRRSDRDRSRRKGLSVDLAGTRRRTSRHDAWPSAPQPSRRQSTVGRSGRHRICPGPGRRYRQHPDGCSTTASSPGPHHRRPRPRSMVATRLSGRRRARPRR